jgi:predicted NUDIX family NTP pyrophosphohydrolase
LFEGNANIPAKLVITFAGEGHFDPAAPASNMFDTQWPPRSGGRQSFPEVDRAEWFDIELARTKGRRRWHGCANVASGAICRRGGWRES